jgi:hypothetical protein
MLRTKPLLTKPLYYELNLLYPDPDEDDEVEGAVVEDTEEVVFTEREREWVTS